MVALTAATISLGIAAAGVAASAGGAALSYEGAQRQAKAEENIAAQQKQQTNLDAARQRRSIARQAILSRSSALSNATNQGAGYGGSSGVAGGQSGITAQENVAGLGLNQNTQIANNIFGQQQAAYQGGTLAATGGAISQFGGILSQNSSTLGKVGSYAFKNSGWGG